MPQNIEIEFDARYQAIRRKLSRWGGALPRAAAAGMNKALPQVVSAIQAQRLTGYGPFPVEEHRLGVGHKHGGLLRRSARWTPAVIEGKTVTGAIGDPVPYAAVHEFGFQGPVRVNAFTRRVKSRDIFSRVERVSKKTGRAYKTKEKSASGVTQVSAHTRQMNMPARAPFGFGIADNMPTITREIADAAELELGRLE